MDLGICERWRISTADLGDGAQPWFLDWVKREPEQVSRHLTAGLLAYGSLQSVYGPGELRSVHEYFGGIGAQTLMIQDGFRPESHVVLDNSPESVAWLRAGLRHRPVQVRYGDSYLPEFTAKADLVGLDFGDLTAWRLRPGQKQRELLDRVMRREPKAVVLTDIAGPRLHLHRERYGEVLHRRPQSLNSYPTYLYALVDWMRAYYGLRLVRGYQHRWSAVLAFVPVDRLQAEGHILPVPDSPKGLTVHE